jgi:RNA polymerase sigma factor (sigma-70 family)
MASDQFSRLARGIERIFTHGSFVGVDEDRLLPQCAKSGNDAAFEALVTRNGPLVLAVCRRMLSDPRDVEDAFQATFLVLYRRAGSLAVVEPLGPWLHGVAYRVAARIRASVARRSQKEREAARPEAWQPECTVERDELKHILDEEIQRLPDKYRKPVVLCYLEGKTHDQAARHLRWSPGSVRGRLDRARAKLRDRLQRRGLAPETGLVVPSLAAESARAAIPPGLFEGTVATLGRSATAQAVSATAGSAAVRALADGLIRSMMVAKLKLLGSMLTAAAVIVALGTALLITLPHSLGRDGLGNERLAATLPGDAPGRTELSRKDDVPGSIDYRVVNKQTSKPIPEVTLIVHVDGNETSRLLTDNEGRARIPVPVPPPVTEMAVLAHKAGFAPMRSFMRRVNFVEDIPPTYTLPLVPVDVIAGVVRDEQGKPVAGVEVTPLIWTRSDSARQSREDFEEPIPVRTDEEGRWRWDELPAGIEPGRVSFRFSHPDYQRLDLPAEKGLEIVRANGVTVLPRGVELAGRVVDSAGRGIAGARVLRGSSLWLYDSVWAQSNDEGRFRFAHAPAGDAILTAQARAHSPDLKRVTVAPGLGPVEFRLEQARTIRGRIVNRLGQPLTSVRVAAEYWRKHQTLDWHADTDEQGRFQWDSAPFDAVTITVFRAGYLAVRGQSVPADAAEISITLVKELKVRGTVVDAETRHAVKSFTLVPGMESSAGGSTYWERDRARGMRGGRYEIRFDDAVRWDGRRIRIEADGYAPGVSRVIRDDEDGPVVNFVLHKADGISGVVHLPDHSPLAGADVVLVSPSQPAFITNGRPPVSIHHPAVKTGADGRFTFPPQEPPYTLLVLHDQGFAEKTIEAQPSPAYKLTISPWGHVEGTLRIGARPASGHQVSLGYQRQGDTPKAVPWWSGEVKTDATGRFTFKRVIPGEVWIARDIVVQTTPSRQMTYRTGSVSVEVLAGAKTESDLGGSGRPIKGKVIASPEISGDVDWTQSNNSLILQASASDLFKSAVNGLRKVMGASSGRNAQRSYAVVLEPDGSFRVDDVEAGRYDLIIVVNEPTRDPRGFVVSQEPLGTARLVVTVPEMPGGRSDEALDVGPITLTLAKKLPVIKPGDLAPAFHIETLDGKPISLADFRGKYVLLDFWAAWCGPCLAETPHLKETFEAYGNDARFVMIGLSLDKSKDDLRKYAVAHGTGWIQGFVGEWSSGKLPDAYGVRGIPSIWLIGPDGNVIARDLRGSQIKKAVAEALVRP